MRKGYRVNVRQIKEDDVREVVTLLEAAGFTIETEFDTEVQTNIALSDHLDGSIENISSSLGRLDIWIEEYDLTREYKAGSR